MPVYLSVVEMVFHSRLKVAEKPEQIDKTADAEPEGRDCRHYSRYYEVDYEEICTPPFDRPGRECVPDNNYNENTDEVIDKTVEEE